MQQNLFAFAPKAIRSVPSATPARLTGLLAAMAIAQSAVAADLIADYLFQNSFEPSIPGPPALEPVAPGVFASSWEGEVDKGIWAFESNAGVTLDTSGMDLASGFSIAMRFELDTLGNYRKLIDFKNRSVDSGLYLQQSDLFFYNAPGRNGTSAGVEADEPVQVVYTWTAGAEGEAAPVVHAYIRGVLEQTFEDTGAEGFPAGALHFFQDDSRVTGEHSAGSVARISIWRGVLTPEEVAALEENAAPPCPADRDADGDSDVQDLLGYLRSFRGRDGDMDGDEDTDVQDLLGYLRAFRAGC